jgi:hypothetical protein
MNRVQLEERLRVLVEEAVIRILKGRLLVIMTGGTIGAEAALKQLEKTLALKKVSIDVMFSAAGSRIHNTKSTMDRLKAHKIFIEGSERIESIKDYTGVIFPVLSRNTASKGANLIFDGYAAELMVDALMLGIPVVAAKDAADVESLGWSKLGFRWANANLKGAFSKNLSILEAYGVHLCAADELGDMVESVIFGDKTANNVAKIPGKTSVVRIDKNPVTRKDIAAYLDGEHEIYIPRSVLITPLAQDVIRDFNLKIIRE